LESSPKHAVIVCGAESTGTRLVTRLFMLAGFEGDADHVQRWDTESPTAPMIVWRRSLPHAHRWPRFGDMIKDLRRAGYTVSACVVTRDWHAAVQSQLKVGHAHSAEQALQHLRRAYAEIPAVFRAQRVPYILVSYEGLVARPWQAPEKLLQLFGFPAREHWLPIVDENAKHYDTIPTMLTAEQRSRLMDLNTDHHRRMTLLSVEHQRQNRTALYQQQNDQSRAALMTAVKGCEARYSMRTAPAAVLELGASFGGERPFLLDGLGASDYVGVEIVEAAANSSPHVVHGAIEDAPEEWNGRFQYIWSRHVMEHVIDVDVALDALHRVLAPNGIIAAVTPHFFPDPEPAHVTQLRMAEWIAAYQRHGLHVVYAVLANYVCPECHIVAVHEEWPRD